jgi:hypothetical protein
LHAVTVVNKLDVALHIEHDVATLDLVVDNEVAVQELDALEHAPKDVLADGLLDVFGGLDEISHVVVHQLHDHEHLLLDLVDIAFLEINYEFVFVALHYLDFI